MRAVSGIFAQLILTTSIFSLSMFFTSVAGVLRLLPLMVPLACRAAWGLLILSCRFYYLLLSRVAPAIERHTKVNLVAGIWRLVTTSLLSLTLGLAFLWLMQWGVSGWAIAVFALHGLFVDLIWEEIPQVGDLQMGVKLKWDN